MAELKGGYTGKQVAIDIALGWLAAAYRGETNDVGYYASTPGLQRDVRREIAKLHNKLLDESELDGIALEENVQITSDRLPSSSR